MCIANREIIAKVQELMELRRLSEELTAEIDALQEIVKDFMGSEETMIAGAFKVSYKSVTSSRLDSTALRRELPDVAARYMQDIDLDVDDLQAVLIAGMRLRKLVDLGKKPCKADITITNGAHRQIRSMDKLHRRALSKAMRDNFYWKRSSVCIYSDWNENFAFVDQRMSGGLCLHESKVIDKDGKLHQKLTYQVHT